VQSGSYRTILPFHHSEINHLREMAEWGKGDPRWIVEERPDGKKINDMFFYFKCHL
jgi:hypothetical protein